MKKKILIGVLSGAMVLGGAIAAGATNEGADSSDDIQENVDISQGEAAISSQNDDNKDDAVNYEYNKAANSEDETISREEAIAIAEKAVNGKVYSFEKDNDDGRLEYELELTSDKGQVDIEMDAVSGEIIEMDYEDLNDDKDDDDRYDNDDNDDRHDD